MNAICQTFNRGKKIKPLKRSPIPRETHEFGNPAGVQSSGIRNVPLLAEWWDRKLPAVQLDSPRNSLVAAHIWLLLETEAWQSFGGYKVISVAPSSDPV